jgi:hypothetical protein
MAEDDIDEPTAEWPTLDEDTDPAGFAPIYRPPADPFVDDAEDDDLPPLPGWGNPAKEERKSRRRLLVVGGLFVFLAAMVGVILLVSGDRGATIPKALANGRTSAAFEVVDGAGTVRIRAADLGAGLYRISSDVTPRVEDDGQTLKAHLPAGAKAVEIVLNARVRWTLRLRGGAATADVDLSNARVDSVDLEGGATRIDLSLPAPNGRIPVRMSGGVDQFQVRLRGETPVRVQVQSGAGQVTLAGATHRGIAPGKEFTAYGWNQGGSGIDLTAAAGMSALTVTLG